MAATERIALEQINVSRPPSCRSGPTPPTSCSRATKRSSWPESRSRCSCPGIAGPYRYYADGSLFSGDVLFAGSVGRTDLPFGDWDTLVASIRLLADRFPAGDGRLPRPWPDDDARRRARTQPVPRRAPRLVSPRFEAPRGRTTSCRPTTAAGNASRAGRAPLRASTATADPDPPFRGHRTVRPHVGGGFRRRAEGDVHLRGSRRPFADPAGGRHGADLQGLLRAWPPPRAPAAEALHHRADLATTARRRAGSGSTTSFARGDRHRRPCNRRRADPALLGAAPPAWRHRVQVAAQFDRRSKCRPAYIERLTEWLDDHDASLDETRAQKRATTALCASSTSKDRRVRAARTTRRRSASPSAGPAGAHFAAVRSCLGAYGIEYELVPPRPWTRLLHPDDLRVHRPRARCAKRDLAEDGTTGRSRRSAVHRLPGVGFGAGIERLLLALGRRSRVARRGADRRLLCLRRGSSPETCARADGSFSGGPAVPDTDYADRSLKGQLTQAGRVGARVDRHRRPSTATIRAAGTQDVEVPLEELAERLSA